VVPFVAVAVMFYFTVSTENTVLKLDPNPDVKVDVTAFKWNWEFQYEDTTVAGTGQKVATIGTSEEIPVLILPNDSTIQYKLESRDVVHSFWVPAFDFKRDVFPHPEKNNTENLIQTTLTRTGACVGRCAELCGNYHSAINFDVRSVPENIYNAYLELRQQKNPATGAGYTTAEALAQVGKEHPECGALCSPTATTTYPLATDRQAKTAPQPPANVTGNK
jgi:cytochrome c oxidase subunit 2